MITPTIWVTHLFGGQSKIKLLDKDKDKLKQITNQKRRLCFITGRTLLYKALLDQDIDYQSMSINYHLKGKPYLSRPIAEFNLSHSGDYLFLAIMPSNCPVGIDCEQLKIRQYQSIINEYFYFEEINYIKESDSLNRFYQLWTIKEALIKQQSSSIFNQKKLPLIKIKNNKIDLPNIYLECLKYKNTLFSFCLPIKLLINYNYYSIDKDYSYPIKPKSLLSTNNN